MATIPYGGICIMPCLGVLSTALRGLDVTNTPLTISKEMQMSSNPEIQNYGYRLEAALLREKKEEPMIDFTCNYPEPDEDKDE